MLSVLEFQPEEESPEQQKLYEACLKGSRDELSRLFENGNDTSTYFQDGLLPTHVVALAGRRDAEAVLEFMLQNGFDVNAQTKVTHDTLLHLVVENIAVKEAFPLVLKILEFNPDLNIRNRKLRTPYDVALARGHFELAETLDGHLSATEARAFYLQRIGAIYGENGHENTSVPRDPEVRLVEAVIDSNEKDIEDYIRLGADPNFVNEHQNAAIHYAVTHCTLPPIRTLTSLVSAGADVNLQDAEGDTALNLVIKSTKLRDTGDMYKCAELLVQNGALSTFKDLDGNDALTLARKKNYGDIIRLLASGRAQHIQPTPEPTPIPVPEPEDEDEFEHPPPGFMENREPDVENEAEVHLINAIRFEGIEQVQSVIQDYNPDVNQSDQDGLYPIHHAVMREDIEQDEREEIVGELLDAGADVNVKTTDFECSPLHLAAINNQPGTAKQLLDTHKCNYNDKNMEGKTAYECAEEEGNQEVMDVIDNHRDGVRNNFRRGAKKASTCTIL